MEMRGLCPAQKRNMEMRKLSLAQKIKTRR